MSYEGRSVWPGRYLWLKTRPTLEPEAAVGNL